MAKLLSQFKFPFSRFVIKDHSMEPMFREYDRVLTYNWGVIKKGSVIVFREGKNYFVKRVFKIEGEKFHIRGDNKKMSSKMTPVSSRSIVGRVFIKY